jgi:hypothetical protein
MGLAGLVRPGAVKGVLLGVRSGGEALAQHRRPAAGRDRDLRRPRGRRVEGRLGLGDGGRGDRRRRGAGDRALQSEIRGPGPARVDGGGRSSG